MLNIGFDKLHNKVPLKENPINSSSLDLRYDTGYQFEDHVKCIFNVDLDALSFEEQKNIKKFLKFSQRELFKLEDLNSILLEHDIAHIIGIVAQGRHKINEGSILPPFFEFKRNMSLNDKECMENEIYAQLFAFHLQSSFKDFLDFNYMSSNDPILNAQVPIKNKAYYIDYMKSFNENKNVDFSSFLNFCLKFSLFGLTKNENQEMYFKMAHSKAKEYSPDEWQNDYIKIANSIIENPPKVFTEMLRFVYDNKDDPKVLVRLFMKYCGDFVKEIKS